MNGESIKIFNKKDTARCSVFFNRLTVAYYQDEFEP